MKNWYSLLALLLATSVAVVFSVGMKSFFVSAKDLGQIQKVADWFDEMGHETTASIAVNFEGRSFGISNVEMRREADGGWTMSGKNLKGNLFVYPPGKVVASVEEAFREIEIETRIRNKKNESRASDTNGT